MTTVSFKIDLKPDGATWEERRAHLAAMPEAPPDSEIDFSEIPELTEERFARMRPFWEIIAERRAQRELTEVTEI